MKYLLLLFLLSPAFLYAQVKHVKRIEFELKEGYSNHQLAQFGEDGVLIYSKEDNNKSPIFKWKIERYSTDLELNETTFIEIPKGQYLKESFEDKNNLYLFFSERNGAYTIFKINARKLSIDKQNGALPKKVYVSEAHVLDNVVFLIAYKKKEQFIYTIDMKSGENSIRPILIDGYKSKSLSFENAQVQEKSNEFFVYVNAYAGQEHDIFVMRFDRNGEKKEVFQLTDNIDKKLSSISASYINKDEYIYTGTYSERSSTSSEGVYICKTKNSKIEFIRFYNFLDFKEFLSYLPEKKQAKIEKKKEKKEKKGKELKISYRIAAHDIFIRDNKFIFLGEAFYPTYRTETYYTTGANGQRIAQTRTVFDGYQYTHATLAAFDKKGTLLWDQSFKMYPYYKPYYVKKFISTSEATKNRINLLFSSGSSIYAKSFTDEGEVVNDKTYEYIDTENDADKVKYSFSNMDYWYGKYFLTHGNQRIKNTEEKGKKKRRVYFINKISYK